MNSDFTNFFKEVEDMIFLNHCRYTVRDIFDLYIASSFFVFCFFSKKIWKKFLLFNEKKAEKTVEG